MANRTAAKVRTRSAKLRGDTFSDGMDNDDDDHDFEAIIKGGYVTRVGNCV